MNRRSWGKKVDTVTDAKLGISVPIYMDKEFVFRAEYGDKQFVSKTAGDVATNVLKAIRDANELSWQPVILVRYKRPPDFYFSQHRPNEDRFALEVDFERFYIAKRFDGTWSQVDWHIEPEHRVLNAKTWSYGSNGNIPFTYKSGFNTDIRFLPYSEELWAGIRELFVALKTLHMRLVDMVNDEDGSAMIANVGAGLLNLLPASVEVENAP